MCRLFVPLEMGCCEKINACHTTADSSKRTKKKRRSRRKLNKYSKEHPNVAHHRCTARARVSLAGTCVIRYVSYTSLAVLPRGVCCEGKLPVLMVFWLLFPDATPANLVPTGARSICSFIVTATCRTKWVDKHGVLYLVHAGFAPSADKVQVYEW